MAPRDLSTRVGRYVVTTTMGERVRAYVPVALPPEPELELKPFQRLLEDANQALGRLDGVSMLLPDLMLFLYTYVRKEAVVSSQIEGTQSSLSDLMLFENDDAPGAPLDDVQEVSSYVAALLHGLERLKGGFPLSLRLIRELHGALMRQGRGMQKQPGEFRRSQNWIGGARPGTAHYVPPPPAEMMECLGDLETFLHVDRPDLPVLVKAALAHVQFETIHPFLDGNGRVGRLLITLMLCTEGVLRAPILYLSLYFKKHRQDYYELLDGVRRNGDWERWVEFFLLGVKETSEQAAAAARDILALFEADRKKVEGLKRPATSALRVYEELQRRPIGSIPKLAEKTGMSEPTVAKSMGHLRKLGIVREITGRQRRRLFVYDRYLAILNEGTEPLAAGA